MSPFPVRCTGNVCSYTGGMRKLLTTCALLLGVLGTTFALPAHAGYWSWTTSVCRSDVHVYDRPENGAVDMWTDGIYGTFTVSGRGEQLYWQFNRECGGLNSPLNNGGWVHNDVVGWYWSQDFRGGAIQYMQSTNTWYVWVGGAHYGPYPN